MPSLLFFFSQSRLVILPHLLPSHCAPHVFGTSVISGASHNCAARLPLPSQKLVLPFSSCPSSREQCRPPRVGSVDPPKLPHPPARHAVFVDNFIHNFNRFTSLVLSPCATSPAFGAGSTLSSYQYGSDLSASRHMPSFLAVTSQKSSHPISANILPSVHSSIGHLRPGHVLSPMLLSFRQRMEPYYTLAPCKAHVSSKSKASPTPSMPSLALSDPSLGRRTVRARRRRCRSPSGRWR